eukprot:UN2939
MDRMRHNLVSRCLPLARWLQKRSMKKMEDAMKSMPKAQHKTMDEALALQLMPPGNEHGAHSWAMEQLHLLNGYWMGHGASSAGLIAATAREHLRQSGATNFVFRDMSVLYMNPVPPFKPVGFVVTPLGTADAEKGIRPYVVEMRSEKKAFVRARLTAVLS